jgi:UDP-glucose:glycoprotein glucosyltransferase
MLAEDEDSPVVEITAIIDPLSRAAQKLAPILQTLLKVLNADFRLAMNPKQRLSELPLKRYVNLKEMKIILYICLNQILSFCAS